MNSEVHFDVRSAIEKNSYLTSVTDLERRGKRQVKVIKTSLIYDLINRAVENAHKIHGPVFDEEERQRLVEESKAEFDRLMEEQATQKKQLDELQEAIQRYEQLIQEQNQRLAEHEESLQTETERARSLEAENEQQQARVRELTEKFTVIQQEQTEETAGLDELQNKIHGLEEALKVARQVAQEKEHLLLQERQRLQQEETSRGETAGRLNEVIRKREAEREMAETTRKANEEYRLQIASLSAELKALRENQPAAESLLNELKAMREDFRTLENRNRELEALAAAPRTAAPDTEMLEKLFEKKMAQITSEISAKLDGMKHGSDVGTSPEDIKLTIQRIFSNDMDRKVDSNIGEIKVKESTSGGIAANLERLKNLGLDSENK